MEFAILSELFTILLYGVPLYVILLFVLKKSKFLKKRDNGIHSNSCPDCQDQLKRVKRYNNDHYINYLTFTIFNFKRYKCNRCSWEGLRWGRHTRKKH